MELVIFVGILVLQLRKRETCCIESLPSNHSTIDKIYVGEGLNRVCAKLEPVKSNEILEINVLQKFSSHVLFDNL